MREREEGGGRGGGSCGAAEEEKNRPELLVGQCEKWEMEDNNNLLANKRGQRKWTALTSE